MARFSKSSLTKLKEAHEDLQIIFNEVITAIDCTILVGERTEDEQNKLFTENKSKLKYPNSKHNTRPSDAIDAAPCPIDWDDTKRFYFFAGYVLGVADRLLKEGKIKSKIRWGGDWDMDKDLNDQNFMDLVHFERIEWVA